MILFNERRFSVNVVPGFLLLWLVSACNQSTSAPPPRTDPEPDAIRNIDGSGNNAQFPDMGKAGSMLVRQADSDYADDVSQMAGANRPNPRFISNIVNQRPASARRNTINASDFVWPGIQR